MNRLILPRLLTLAALAFFIGSTTALGGGKSDAEVKVTTKSSKPDAKGQQTIDVTIAINPGWYIYANPVGVTDPDFDSLNLNATVITVKGKVKPAKVVVQYPKGEKYEDKDAKLSYQIYHDKVTIPVQVVRAAGDTGPLELTISVNACHKVRKVCLPTGKIKVTVD